MVSRLVTVALLFLLIALAQQARAEDEDAADSTQQEEAATGFSMHLTERDDNSAGGFRLCLAEDTLDPVPPAEVSSLPPLTLSSLSEPDYEAPNPLNGDFAEELRKMRWPDGVGRMGHHVVSEQARVMSGGLKGLFRASGESIDGSLGVPIDFVAIGRIIGKWWRSRQENRRPEGARLPRDATLHLVVREADGSVPNQISVLPLTVGWIGEAMPGSCDQQGRCTVEGLPGATSTLLVRGSGAAIVAAHRFDRELPVTLRPAAWLKLEPASDARPLVRIVDETTRLTVPVIRWMNPERGEWVTLTAAGLPLLLPAGTYTVEVTSPGDDVTRHQIAVAPGTRTELVLE